MIKVRARHPQLLNLGDRPTIIGHRCLDCGRLAFPPDPYGCEGCGAVAERLTSIGLEPVGTIAAVATVHRHHNPWPETPFTVATIVLDDGVSLKAVLTGDTSTAAPGDRVRGVTVPSGEDDGGTTLVDLQFALDRPAIDRPGGDA